MLPVLFRFFRLFLLKEIFVDLITDAQEPIFVNLRSDAQKPLLGLCRAISEMRGLRLSLSRALTEMRGLRLGGSSAILGDCKLT